MMDAGRDFDRMQDYVAGRLSDEEQRSFEERLAHEPGLAGEFEHWLRLRGGLERLRDQGYFNGVIPQRAGWRLWIPGSLAAALLAAALIFWLQPHTHVTSLLSASLPGGHGPVPAASVAAHFTFIAMRGDSIPYLELPAAGTIELQVKPAYPAPDNRYRLALARGVDAAAVPLAMVTAQTDDDGFLRAYADAARLAPGSYRLRIAPASAAAAAADQYFVFTLHRAATP